MTDDRMALVDLLQKSGDGDFLRAVAEAVLQILMEADVEGLIGAGRHERSAERLNYRNGYRERSLDTRLGSLQLRIPKLLQQLDKRHSVIGHRVLGGCWWFSQFHLRRPSR
jgi:putative transposase